MRYKREYFEKGQSTTLFIILGIVVVAAIAGLIYYTQTSPPGEEAVEIPETTQPIETEEDLGATAEDPEQFVGEIVEVAGEVEALYGNNSFTLEEDELFDTQILVVSEDNLANRIENTDVNTFTNEDRVRVTGTLQRFVTADVEQDLGITLDPEIEIEFTGNYYINATAIEVNPTE